MSLTGNYSLRTVSRRQFLQSGAIVLSGLALPHLVRAEVRNANERIGIGVIGIGRQASDLTKMISGLKDARLVGFADVNLKRAKDNASLYKAEFAVQDYRRLLDQREVDAIITATPEHWRSLICIHSCQARKDLYIEKPLSLTIHEGRLMVQAARQYERVVQTGSQQRSMWPNRAGCELVRAGAFGKIAKVYCWNYPSPWECGLPEETIPAALDWDRWCGPTAYVPYNKDLYLPRANPGWLSFRPYSGGEMTGWGAHGFDQVQWALGMDDSGPIEAWTEGHPYDPPTYRLAQPKTSGDQQCSEPKVFLRYAGGIVVELANKDPFGGTPPPGGATFVGETGRITIDRGIIKSDPPEVAEAALENRPKTMTENHLKNWLDCIRSRKKPIADIETGHRSASVCHLGNIARWTGRRLKWDPVKETFPDDAEANRYLDRTHRKGYELPDQI